MATHLWHVKPELFCEVVHHLVGAEDGGRQVEGGLVLRVGRVGRVAVPPAPLVAEKEEEEEESLSPYTHTMRICESFPASAKLQAFIFSPLS